MSELEFRGKAAPVDEGGVGQALDQMRASAADLWAVIGVETSGCGFIDNRRPQILFERHVFSRLTRGRFDAAHPDISNPVAGGYGPGGAAQYDRLERAMALDREAALSSTSWGLGQILGTNAVNAGFANVSAMIDAMCDAENAQVLAMARFIVSRGLDDALRRHDWAQFARGYNGPAFQEHAYDMRLAAAHDAIVQRGLPDLMLRAAQLYLTFLGFRPGPVDGMMGPRTLAALNRFQASRGLPATDRVDAATFDALRAAANAGTAPADA
ncbi:MAG TPA: N-acetylmuramidase domain-containing protein [Usitatibacter sp.]|jgi:N-acetylmuramidase-like protein/putative peptidoglycan binding protein|nr:N-acetylmuramidase domain-containing protein [Usitatibacter sp.]